MMKSKRIGLAIIFLVIVSNCITLISVGKPYVFKTQNDEFVYRLVPSKGGSEEFMLEKFKEFKSNSPQNGNVILYRTFKTELWKFWNWREYLFNDLYRYPYKVN